MNAGTQVTTEPTALLERAGQSGFVCHSIEVLPDDRYAMNFAPSPVPPPADVAAAAKLADDVRRIYARLREAS